MPLFQWSWMNSQMVRGMGKNRRKEPDARGKMGRSGHVKTRRFLCFLGFS